mgnify:CR=1 FL=1
MGVREDLLAIPDDVLRSGQIGQAALVWMDFAGGAKRWWTGFGDLDAGGHRWQGVGDLISISPISTAYDLSAEPMTFTLACTPELLALAINAKARVRDRPVTVSLQLFDMDTKQVLGSPFVMFSGTMQRMPWKASGPTERTLTLEAEGLFFRRNAPPRGRWTDADQKARYPGDRGFERMPIYANGYESRWRG